MGKRREGREAAVQFLVGATTLSAVIGSSRAWSAFKIRCVIGTPRSERMSASSSSSQSTGRPVNF